jgi:hypothetical protein
VACGVAGVVILVAASSVGGKTVTPCGPSDPTIAQRGSVRVFADRTHHYVPGLSVRGYVVACDGSSGASAVLTSEGEANSLLMPGSVSIAGGLVAYGYVQTSEPYGPTDTFVDVKDLSQADAPLVTGGPARPREPLVSPDAPPDNLAKVVLTAVNTDGAVAWISCDAGDVGPSIAIGRHARCQRPGRYAFVYTTKGNAAISPTLLDQGRGIAPRSLRLTGSTISWVDHGKRRTTPTA